MQISSVLLQNKLKQLENDLDIFGKEMAGENTLPYADINDSFQRNRNKVDRLKSRISEEGMDEVTLTVFHDLQKELRLDLRLMRRKLKRQRVNQAKLERKLSHREANVATVAA